MISLDLSIILYYQHLPCFTPFNDTTSFLFTWPPIQIDFASCSWPLVYDNVYATVLNGLTFILIRHMGIRSDLRQLNVWFKFVLFSSVYWFTTLSSVLSGFLQKSEHYLNNIPSVLTVSSLYSFEADKGGHESRVLRLFALLDDYTLLSLVRFLLQELALNESVY